MILTIFLKKIEKKSIQQPVDLHVGVWRLQEKAADMTIAFLHCFNTGPEGRRSCMQA